MSDFKIKSRLEKLYNYINFYPFKACGVLALVLNTLIEMLSRRSIFGGLEAFSTHPVMFFYNSLIIGMTLSVCVLFRRRIFVITLVSLFWLACGVTNCVLLSFRTTPFSAVDLQILSSVIGVINVYLNGFELFLIITVILAAIAVLTVLFFKTPRTKGQIHYIKACSVLGVLLTSALIINDAAIAAESDSANFPNIADAYEDYGFVYCFSNSLLDSGIDKPEDYSASAMAASAAEIGSDSGMHSPDVQPNIVIVQLESFFDVNYVKDMEFSENPLPNFTKLKENNTHGFLTVPSIGAGTANTEFEILSGLSLDFFGASEYPYKTVLKTTPCESICYNLADYGYTSHAIHNNDGTFYDRHMVYPQLGFDSFTSVEYMQNVEYNPIGWADDSVIVQSVIDALDSTENRDFVFAVSVQPHGKYPSEMPENAPEKIKITQKRDEMTEEQSTAFTYYVNQIYETDEFIGELTAAVEAYSEPVVLVLYGDHLPNLSLEDENLENGNLLQTEYVVLSNFGFNPESKDLTAYQLSAYICGELGFGGGYLSSYNRNHSDDAGYPEKMQDIGYDMLFGEQYAFGGYESAEMRMGTKDISVSDYKTADDAVLYVYGENFTEYSFITVNERKIETVLIDENTLSSDDAELEQGDIIAVAQAGKDGEILSSSNMLTVG